MEWGTLAGRALLGCWWFMQTVHCNLLASSIALSEARLWRRIRVKSLVEGWPRLRCNLAKACLILASDPSASGAFPCGASDSSSAAKHAKWSSHVTSWTSWRWLLTPKAFNMDLTNFGVYWATKSLTLWPLRSWPATTLWLWWPGHRHTASKDSGTLDSDTIRPVAFWIGSWVSGHVSPKAHMSTLKTPYFRFRDCSSGDFQMLDGHGCSNMNAPPRWACLWICFTQNRRRARFLLISWALSNGVR